MYCKNLTIQSIQTKCLSSTRNHELKIQNGVSKKENTCEHVLQENNLLYNDVTRKLIIFPVTVYAV